jgi:hypothetical protein
MSGQIRFVTCLIAFSGISLAAEPLTCDRHIIIAYSIAEQSYYPERRLSHANDYLEQLLFTGGVRPGPGDSMPVNRLAAAGLSGRLYRSDDCVSFFSTGIADQDLSNLPGWQAFSRSLVRQIGSTIKPGVPEVEAREQIQRWLPRAGSIAKPFEHPLTGYVLPALFSSLPEAFAGRTLVLAVSDPAIASKSDRAADKEAVRRFAGSPAEALAERARDFFDQRFAVDSTLFQVETQEPALSIQIVEISPLHGPTPMFAPGKATIHNDTDGRWQLSWPAPRLASVSPESFRDVAQSIMSIGKKRSFEFQLAKAASNAVLTESDHSSLGSPIQLQARFWTRYTPGGEFNMYMPLFIQTMPLPLEDPWRPIPWIVLSAVMIAGAAALYWWLYQREPRIDLVGIVAEPDRSGTKDIQGKPLSDENVDGIMLRRIRWSKGATVRFTIQLRNKVEKFPQKPVRVTVTLSKRFGSGALNNAQIGFVPPDAHSKHVKMTDPDILSIHLGPAASESIHVQLILKSGEHEVPEPQYPDVLRAGFTLSLKDSHGGERQWHSGFQIEENPGLFWVAVDPGTTASCVALASGVEDPRLVDLQPHGIDEETREVMPSFVYVCRDSYEADAGGALHYTNARGEKIAYLCGESAWPHRNDANRCFHSPKRLIGYNAVRTIDYKGRLAQIDGHDAVSMIVDFLLSRVVAEQPKLALPGKINKLVVAVPNMFTPGRVQAMIKACRRPNIQRVDHIYEAEATLMYYLWSSRTLLSEENLKARKAMRAEDGERVLILDFGGSSLNLTYAVVREGGADRESRLLIEVIHRLGYQIGGNHLDWEIAQVLYDRVKAASAVLRNLPPLLSDPRELTFTDAGSRANWIKYRDSYWTQVERTKRSCSERWQNEKERAWNPFEGDFAITDLPSPKAIVEDERLQNVIRMIEEAIREMKAMCSDRWKGADTLLCSGRSIRFPEVRDRAVTTLHELSERETLGVYLSAEEQKTCVAKGAAYWASRQEVIRIHPIGTFAHYGVVRHGVGDDRTYVPLIPAGQPFDSDEKCTGKVLREEFPLNAQELIWYQVMGSDPQSIAGAAKQKHRCSRLCRMALTQLAKEPADLQLTIDKNDDFTAEARCGAEEQRETGKFVVNEVLEDQDESARWLVVPPDVHGAAAG